MLRETPFAVGETYHVYNRGAHKQAVFLTEEDYERFLALLYLMNDPTPVVFREIGKKYKGRSYVLFDKEKPAKSLVDILAYTLMPNHFHIVVRQREEGGISKFFKKVMTAYSMYFNTKYDHSGVIFQGCFKSKHIDNESYFRYIFSYVHLNPLSLVEPGWEEVGIINKLVVRSFMEGYKYGSYQDYSKSGTKRPQHSILAENDIPEFLTSQNDLEDLLANLTKDRPLEE